MKDQSVPSADEHDLAYLTNVVWRDGFEQGRINGITEALHAVNSIPYTHVDGVPFIIRGEASEVIQALGGES
jgi:hypothetical protein